MKKILLRLCVIMSLFTICMFGSTTSNATSTQTQQVQQKPNFDKETVGKYAQQLFMQWSQMDLSYMGEPDRTEIYQGRMTADEFANQKAWYEVVKKAGKFEKILNCKVEMDEKGEVATATVIAKYSKEEIKFMAKFDKSFVYSNPEVTINGGDKPSVAKALMNTLMGMGTVFIVLIFISFIIALFKFIPSLFDKSNKKTETKEAPVVKEEVVVEEEEELADDGELVAVITAAIMASLGDAAPADGLVVRSIRKVNKSKWRNA